VRILWKYLRPQRGHVLLALLLAAAAQVLALVDPIIFGWLIDDYANQRHARPDDELVSGALGLLALAVVVAIASRACKALQDYVTRMVVQGFGARIFNDGLRQTLRLRYQEFEDTNSGETLALLLRVQRHRALHQRLHQRAVRLGGGPGLPALVCDHQELAAGAGVRHRAGGAGRALGPAQPADPRPAARPQP
jgi:ABC-type multidrug transport system fused ATPase/permease subunit